MNQTTATAIGAVLFVILIALDIFGALDTTKGNTVSEWIRVLSRHLAVVPWALGILHGHWFHPIDDLEPILGSASIPTLIGLSVAVLVLRWLLRDQERLWLPWVWAIAGVVAGTLLWPVHG